MKKVIILCVAAASLAGLAPERAEAEPVRRTSSALPEVVHINQTVVVRRHRRFRRVRRVYYRNGRRVVVYRRVYY